MTNANTDTTLIPDPRDDWTQDEVLMAWANAKKALAEVKEIEMNIRKYVVKRAFPQKQEGTNVVELGNDYKLKANISYSYSLADNKTVEATLDKISKIGNTGSLIAERLVSVTYNFLLTEYRNLQEQAKDGSVVAQEILAAVGEMLTVSEAAPKLEIKTPKKAKV